MNALRLSRSSVDRAIRDLTEVACVTSEGNEYRATTTGRVALTEYDQYRETAHAIQDADRFLNYLPADEAPDAALLEGAEIALADTHAPEQALESSIDLFRDATVLRVSAFDGPVPSNRSAQPARPAMEVVPRTERSRRRVVEDSSGGDVVGIVSVV